MFGSTGSGRWRALVVAVAVSLALGTSGFLAGPAGGTRRSADRPAPSPAAAEVGPLFAGGPGGRHFCTASVVRSGPGDLILTAAHCVSGTGTGLYFAPGYRDGLAPFGYWRVTAAYVEPAWSRSAVPQADYAFLRVVPSGTARPSRIQAAVGGETLATSPAPGTPVTVRGYPEGSGGGPVACAARTYVHQGYAAFDCAGFSGGTSGGPWLSATTAGAPVVVGLIGGLKQGGCSASVSYSPQLGVAAQALLARAAAGGPADSVPAAPPDGCSS
ncbi:MAG TPA: trypsin-like peptidase domain-containing protein [Acidimicrobiales bacterium]|nr:trypsin-like peptidase domain-containing protein [Acidimicrobiales bacterium]